MTLAPQTSRNQFWHEKWEDAAQQPSYFATMGRNSYSISDYFVYLADIVKGLGGVSKHETMLDAAGGCGYLSMYFSPLVKAIDLFDYSISAIERAQQECQNFANINAYQDNLLDFSTTKKKNTQYEKIIVGGVLQYFDNYDEIAAILTNLYMVSASSSRIIVTHNTDLSKKEQHIASYQNLSWSKEKVERAVFEELNHRFWLDFNIIQSIATKIGFTACQLSPINPQLFQANHMFDFYLEK
ncbi:methyltransferase domain-containing protein [Endozoicomonas sp. G2_1]|uniref:SAM-dependent methyltransferase n=1 Tax=Endozoicomonas sp. G2_1 TaxID=2821091 RepID=UPI001AD990CE|nr:SAM-dependent methyltransferase [Endozoicomonas sp. G2_1]MBO9489050.1 methyltransferase domain-containing protein [Endozoicomonas sp. G2_1]